MSSCPKCGSSQILNGECLKCGLIIARYQTQPMPPPASADKAAPMSYVAPPAPKGAMIVLAHPAGKNLRANIAYTVITVVVLAAAYQIYDYFVRQASAYGGFYRNTTKGFTLNIPEKGWYHYLSTDLRQPEFKDAQDAFYRGGDPEDPDLAMIVWIENLDHKWPDTLDEETARQMLIALEDEVIQRMEKANLKCVVTDSKRQLIGGNEGFLLHADVQKDAIRMKTAIYCAFNITSAYTVQFLGKEQAFLEHDAEIQKMMESFGFRLSLF